MRRKFYLLAGTVLLMMQGIAQTAVTNLSYGSATIGKLYPKGNKVYFICKYAADAQEWFSLNTSNNTLTQITNDHHHNSGGTIFRTPYLIGDNVFVASAKPTALQDIEFSRFNLTTETEQWVDLYPGMNGVNPNYSDPIVYAEDPSNGYVYMRPALASGNQLHYWKPSDNSVTKVSNVTGGIGQNSSIGMVFIGDTIYTAATINAADGLLCMHKTNGGYRFLTGGQFKNARDINLVNNKIYFSGRNNAAFPDDDYNLYVYRPTTGAAVKLTTFTTTEADGNMTSFVGPNGTLYVNVTYYNTNPLQGSFFSVNTTTDAVTYRTGPSATERNSFFYATNTHVYAVRNSGTTRDFYKIQLSDNSSTKINSSSFSAATVGYLASNGRIYFSATDASYGSELYELNLANDVITRQTDINSGTANAAPANFVELNNKLYFSAVTGVSATLDREIYSFNLPSGTLPVSWLSFTAQKQPDQVLLQWQTATEQNSRSFTVQHSEDGIHFASLGTVAAAGNSGTTRSYQFTHTKPSPADNYYRVALTNTDGSLSYSAVKRVNYPAAEFVVINNPVINQQIEINSFSNQYVQVFSNEGRQVLSTRLAKGINKINVAHLTAGTYFVRTANSSRQIILQ